MTMDLLLDVNIVVDICTRREGFHKQAELAIAKCEEEQGKLWLYAGSVQTLEYVMRAELKRSQGARLPPMTERQIQYKARQLLKAFTQDKHWLAALASEGSVFDSIDPEDEQLVLALDRFPADTINLLTRDQDLCARYPEKTTTPKPIYNNLQKVLRFPLLIWPHSRIRSGQCLSRISTGFCIMVSTYLGLK